ncbi:thiamine phosphate synthase [Domibacillus mangrovi]|nr:thiamine phosphate synthase [Domibacillus mangrovi]
MNREQLAVYFIAGTPNCKQSIEETLQAAIDGGITMFQFREKGKDALAGSAKKEQAVRLQALCREANIPFIINDDIELAVEIGADGVHIGQEDEAASSVRGKINGGIVGVSVHTMDEAKKAIADGADYVGTGPIYQTGTKTDTGPVAGTALIKTMRAQNLTIPIVGIGGITIDNAAPVIAAGADGVSIISAISYADDVKQAVVELQAAVESSN